MADNTAIEWTRHPVTGKGATWNPITGCTLVSEGCRHCYAARLAATRLKHHPSRKGLARLNAAGEAKFTGEVRFNEEWLDQPLRWKRPRMIFVCAHGDLFHESVPDAWIDKIFAVMALSPQHTFQVLTKRAKRMREYVAARRGQPISPPEGEMPGRAEGGETGATVDRPSAMAPGVPRSESQTVGFQPPAASACHPLPNVWLGVSAEDQATADDRIPDLLATPAAIRFVSAEPLLGPIDFTRLSPDGESERDALRALTWQKIWDSQWSPEATGVDPEESLEGFLDWYGLPAMPEGLAHPQLDQIIVGGESGDRARPMHPDWPRSIRDQCKAAGTAFFFKQWGEWAPVCAMDEEIIDGCYQPAPEQFPEASRRCKVAHHVLHADGSRHDTLEPMAFLAGTGAMTMFAIGKKLAGRLLDGVEHSGMPAAGQAPDRAPGDVARPAGAHGARTEK